MKKSIKAGLVCVALSAMLVQGCSGQTSAPTIEINQGREQITYNYVTVLRDTVSLTARISCTYRETQSQEVSFSSTGKVVSKVYVSEGDYVKKGDLLVELQADSLEKDIARLEYNIARNKLLLSYLDTNEDIDRQAQWVSYLFGQYLSDDANQEALDRIHANYEKQRENYNDTIEFDEMDLKAKKKELKESRIYAQFDGLVYDIKDRLQGSTSKDGEVIMTIVDNSECIFEAKSPQYAHLFKEGEVYELPINYGTTSGVFEITPFNMSEWGDVQTFTVLSSPDNVSLDVGAFGTMTIASMSAENVLCLPKGTVFDADGKQYVYVVNSDNMREVKFIETGLVGDTSIEIVSGLSEGEKVVKK